MPSRPDPVATPDDAARSLARRLLAEATHAGLAVIDARDGLPGISRIAFARLPDGTLCSLISGLAPHYAALQATPSCALMVGEVGAKGDPLTSPRLMIKAEARFVAATDPARPQLRAEWLALRPRSTVYVDLGDFAFIRFRPLSALLNGGFGKAFSFGPDDLA